MKSLKIKFVYLYKLKNKNMDSKTHRQLYHELRGEYKRYLNNCHPEDSMSFIDYCCSMGGSFKGYKLTIDSNYDMDYVIGFEKMI